MLLLEYSWRHRESNPEDIDFFFGGGVIYSPAYWAGILQVWKHDSSDIAVSHCPVV